MVHGVNAAEGARAGSDAAWSEFAQALAHLRDRRRSQRGSYTYGDEADVRVATALARLRFDPAERVAQRSLLESAGDEVGRHVYARRMFEDSMPGAFIVLSASLAASRIVTLQMEEAFHRTALVRFQPLPDLDGHDPEALGAYLGALLRGFMGEAFNCEARVREVDGRGLEVTLGAGRDANRRRSA